jgi:transposase-like protein
VDFLESVPDGFDERAGQKQERTDNKMRAKRRRLEAGFKAKVGLEALKGIKTVAQIARDYQVHPNQVSQWKSEVSQRLPEVFETGPTVQIQESEKEIERLERKVGQLTMELDWLKKKSRQLGL